MLDQTKLPEILTILQEECAEVIQASTKIQRFGLSSEWNGSTTLESLEKELGDLLCMIDLLLLAGIIDQDKLDLNKSKKLAKLKIWSSICINSSETSTSFSPNVL